MNIHPWIKVIDKEGDDVKDNVILLTYLCIQYFIYTIIDILNVPSVGQKANGSNIVYNKIRLSHFSIELIDSYIICYTNKAI